MSSRTWPVVPFAHTWDNEIRQREATWAKLLGVLTSFRVHTGDKKQIPAWSPALYKDGHTRGKAGVQALSCLVLDYDNGTPIEAALDCWGWRPGILHTSYSHTEQAPRFRVIMPLSQPVPAEDWPAVYAWAERWSSNLDNPDEIKRPEDYHKARHSPAIDAACKDPGRVFYVPAVRSEDAARYAVGWHPDGGYLGTHTPWARQLETHRAQLEARKRRRTFPKREAMPWSAARRRTKQRLRLDPQAREELGQRLGGSAMGDRMRQVPCPGCGASSVWWFLNPDRKTRAECNHRNSCGWSGTLLELGAA